MEIAALEIARLSDEIDQLRLECEHQAEARMTAEAHLLSMEDRMFDLESTIRDECATEFEQRLAAELARFRANMAAEVERTEEHWDRKIDVLERGLVPNDDEYLYGDKENVLVENLEEEVDRLRRDNNVLRRELVGRSPSKRRPLEERDDYAVSSPARDQSPALSTNSSPTRDSIRSARDSNAGGVANLGKKLENMKVSNNGSRTPSGRTLSPTKKVRKLGKRWEDVEEMQ